MDNNCRGGAGIYVHCSAKLVPLRCYEADNLQAVWAKVPVKVGNISCVVRSVYIPSGAVDKIRLFGQQLAHVCSDHDEVMVGMDTKCWKHGTSMPGLSLHFLS